MITPPEFVLYIGEDRFHDFVRRNGLGYSSHRIKGRPYAVRVTSEEQVRGYRGHNCMVVWEEGYERHLYYHFPHKLAQLQRFLRVSEVRGWEDFIFGEPK